MNRSFLFCKPTIIFEYDLFTFVNLFQANGHLLYPLKTSENQRFSDVFGGHKKYQWHKMGQLKINSGTYWTRAKN